ncbi:MAG: ABC transporter ATP-binding protein, partial [Candidatus Izemoplasmatales bacterium]|nr:ABC transporter ATP-binding protein [Candidatus Izemoplasmatales bacterium]
SRLIRFLKPQSAALLAIILLTIIVTFVIVYSPVYQKDIMNLLQLKIMNMAPADVVDQIVKNFLIILVMYLVRFLFETVSFWIGNIVSANLGRNFRNALRDKLETLPIKYYDEHQTGNILSVFQNDVDVVVMSVQQSLIQVIQSILTVIGVLIMMFTISWKLTIISLLILPFYVIVVSKIAKRSQARFIRQQKELGNLNGFIEEYFTAHRVVKLFGKEEDSYNEFQEINLRLRDEMSSAQYLSGLMFPIMNFISNIGYVAVVIVGAVLAGGVPPLLIGDITTFVGYQRSFVNPILNMANIVNTLQSTVAGAERIFELLDAEEEVFEQKVAEFVDQKVGSVTL